MEVGNQEKMTANLRISEEKGEGTSSATKIKNKCPRWGKRNTAFTEKFDKYRLQKITNSDWKQILIERLEITGGMIKSAGG